MTQRLETTLCVDVGGREERTPFGGLVYPGTVSCPGGDAGEIIVVGDRAEVQIGAGAAALTLAYTLRAEHPRLRIQVGIAPAAHAELVVRGMVLEFDVQAAGPTVVAAPGNRVRPGLLLHELSLLEVNGPAGTAGSTGFLALSAPEAGGTTVIWPLCRDALGTMSARRSALGCAVRIDTKLAGVATPADPLPYRDLWIDLIEADWSEVRARIPSWYPRLGIDLPHDQPGWTRTATILEVQFGTSHFGPGLHYSPYPGPADVLADLPRIAGLGFDTLQIMPRQPYPSYAVVDHEDITSSYGDAEALAVLVRAAHERGIRVILDVVMHGVLDKEIVQQAADAVRAGPHGAFLAARAGRYRIEEAAELPYPGSVPWSQHILDFETAWSAGSPQRHPLTREHPEWFYRDSAGEITSVYTKAIDIGHPTWQDYFLGALRRMIADLDVDGFRFDAPTYNGFANWSPRTSARASRSAMASLGLFRMLRESLRAEHPELMFYTEPSGVLLRESMDLVYNYDEHAQLEDLMGHHGAALGAEGVSTIGVRHARDLAAWFAERDAVLPRRAVTAHHIDSHDTFWWPRPGSKWRREQVGLPATRALVSIFALSGGPYMTFIGGEVGIEEHLEAIHRLRRRPELRDGALDAVALSCVVDDVYAVLRRLDDRAVAVLVNTRPRDLPDLTLAVDGFEIVERTDLLTGSAVEVRGSGRLVSTPLPGYGTRVLALRASGAADERVLVALR
ncbi:alpha-amylase family glycosyl hydrolase [Occultella kanbiaonis]|uniref:alpha-amylase family glycosyl hydrolase n=1 Tax=Occultella kanbiaonis TaxID=2675754 RepID=UPI0013D110CA|nr:alpha-amylase family glycosyl hydrolase [Occultella kanbiaonis]